MLKKILIGTAVLTGVSLARPRTGGVFPRQARDGRRSGRASKRRSRSNTSSSAPSSSSGTSAPRSTRRGAPSPRSRSRSPSSSARSDGLEKKITDGEHKVKVKHAALKSGEKSFTFAGRVYSRAQVENDLRLTFDDFRNSQMLLEGKKKLLEARTASLAAAIQKLENVRVAGDHARRQHRAPAGPPAPDPGPRGRERPRRPRRRRARPGQGDPRPLQEAHRGRREDGRERQPARRPGSIPVEAIEIRDISAEVDRYFGEVRKARGQARRRPRARADGERSRAADRSRSRASEACARFRHH